MSESISIFWWKVDIPSHAVRRMTTSPRPFQIPKKEKKNGSRSFTDFVSTPWHSRTDWCKCGWVWVLVLGDRTCREGRTADFCSVLHSPSRAEKRKENVLGWCGENPASKWDGCSDLPQTSPEVPLTPWYCTRDAEYLVTMMLTSRQLLKARMCFHWLRRGWDVWGWN